MPSMRDQVIKTTCELLENQGVHGTGINQIIKASGVPKGSLYYYFPEGKDELVEEAIAWSAQITVDRVRRGLISGDDIAASVRTFVTNIAHYVEVSGFRSGGPLTMVAMETATTNDRLNRACRSAYTGLQAAFESKLAESGYPLPRASELATFITAAIEGGITLARTYHSGDPLRLVAQQLGHMLQTLPEP